MGSGSWRRKNSGFIQVVVASISDSNEAVAYSKRLKEDALLYKQFRNGETDDVDLQAYWVGLRIMKFTAGYPLLLAAHHKLNAEEQKKLAQAIIALVIRHNIVAGQDRGKLESVAYSTAKLISSGTGYAGALEELKRISPSDEVFLQGFKKLEFSKNEQQMARYLLRAFDYALGETSEITVAGPDKVHVEHIYPQTPPDADKWPEHDTYINRIGNLTLLDYALNEKIKNSKFPVKKEKGYAASRLVVTQKLLPLADWNPEAVEARQKSWAILQINSGL
ncbi:MAG TPA: HNH endonuclease family protein [Candidatus Angelobacter sp.]|nr:HNH endonuclease family protein [Candidatus Angelobacter sp.]